MNSKTRKVVFTLAVVGLAAVAVAFAVYSAFSATTSNPGNSFAAGSVTLTGNNTVSPFYNVSGAKPGDSSTAKCMRVTYTGSLPSTVKVYRSAFTGGTGLDQYLNLTITKGPTGSATDCSDFPASGTSVVYSGSLQGLGTSFGDANAVSLTNQAGAAAWGNTDAVNYKVQASLPSGVSNAANGLATGTHAITWEAQNN
jgi:hypothetical protein